MIVRNSNILRGELTHQFPTRQGLFFAALRHLHEDRERNSPIAVPMSELTQQLWKTMFDDRRYIAAVELMLAARQDNELGRILRAEMARWIKIRDDSLLRLLGHGQGGLVGDKASSSDALSPSRHRRPPQLRSER